MTVEQLPLFPVKRCTKCGISQSLENFHRSRRGKFGRNSVCNLCKREYQRARKVEKNAYCRAWYARNIERLRAKNLQYSQTTKARQAKQQYLADPVHVQQAQERARRWYANNTERAKTNIRHYQKRIAPQRRAYYRQRYAEDPDGHRARKQAWLENNPERAKLIRMRGHHKRRALQANAPGYCTKEQLEARIAFYGEQCWICKVPYYGIDHVKPLTKGGSNWPANLRPICRACNTRKSNRWPYP